MITAILAFLSNSWVGSIVQAALSWYSNYEAQQAAAANAEQQAEANNANDGAQSVQDLDSDNAQNAALDVIENQIDNPTPVVVVPPGGKNGAAT